MKNWSLSNLAGTVRNMRNAEVLDLLRRCERRGFWYGVMAGGGCSLAIAMILLDWWERLR